MVGITQDELIYLIRNRDSLKKQYIARERKYLEGLESYAETIEGVALRGKMLKEFFNDYSNNDNDEGFRILEQVLLERENIMKEQAKGLKEFVEKMLLLEQVMAELERLPEPYYTVINSLYSQGKSWEQVAYETAMSRSKVGYLRKIGMKIILKNINQELKNTKIIV